MTNNGKSEANERAAAWTPWLSWLEENPETAEPEPRQAQSSTANIKNAKNSPVSNEDGDWECVDGDMLEWHQVDPFDAQGGTLPQECKDPSFLRWINADGRHLMEDNPEAIRGVTGALQGKDQGRAASVRGMIQKRWKKAAAVYQEEGRETKDKHSVEKIQEKPPKDVTQDEWMSKNLIFPKLDF